MRRSQRHYGNALYVYVFLAGSLFSYKTDPALIIFAGVVAFSLTIAGVIASADEDAERAKREGGE